MKLLILTQKVDSEDSVLGFFHSWILEFSKHCESIIVICLYKGTYDFPKNVKVLSLGKEKGVSRFKYVKNFYRYIWNERENYEAVFVHMNQIYVVLAGILWKIWGKKITLWYTHKSVTPSLHLAVFLSDLIFTASKESFRIKNPKVRVMGHGIDVDFFSPDFSTRSSNTLLSVGRLMPTKRHDIVIEVANKTKFKLRIAGDGPERKNLEILAQRLGAQVEFLGPLQLAHVREEYRHASYLIHTSETGSLDKVVLEAMACELPVISTSNSLGDVPVIKVSPSPKAIAEAILNNRNINTSSLSDYVRQNHSLPNLISNIVETLKKI